ncbi:MAG: bifunctional phosphopantothenoylcysteine decarboxylase/phosphopantothenate--cysteine ligase CoaBC [Campylobacterales bacterium]|nr:bifunctional phosphopantothenoylcysteine decarboxylase/phosphopantothenate--cysteine ligase CoaBC [Campylobacterales bacterium]
MEHLLTSRRILLGVTGSIAAYKSVELARLLIKAGASVRVIMSEEAKRFVTPLTFEAITGERVIHAQSEDWASQENHIHIHRWAELFCIAPATANTLNKLSHGIADALLLQTALACPHPLVLAPAANTHMIEHPATQVSLKLLRQRGACIVEPIAKLLACQTHGKGAMAEPQSVFWYIAQTLLRTPALLGKKILVTGGGTTEAIDAVRCLSNHSSGKMAEALALALFLKGAQPTLLTSASPHAPHLPFARYSYTNTASLKRTLFELLPSHTALMMAAAVSDYLPKKPFEGKAKKSDLGTSWNLELVENEDILTQAAATGIRCIGFKAETNPATAHANARAMLNAKGVDGVCLNILNETLTFGSDTTQLHFLTADKEITFAPLGKLEAALELVEACF